MLDHVTMHRTALKMVLRQFRECSVRNVWCIIAWVIRRVRVRTIPVHAPGKVVVLNGMSCLDVSNVTEKKTQKLTSLNFKDGLAWHSCH